MQSLVLLRLWQNILLFIGAIFVVISPSIKLFQMDITNYRAFRSTGRFGLIRVMEK